MTSIYHLSDLHFGPKFNSHMAELALQDIVGAKPDLTILSGDFTMRGRVEEYQQARAYIDRIPKPILTIPGNHDQPLYASALWERVTTPWARYTKQIHATVDASIGLPGVFVAGLNTNHPIVPGGILSSAQCAWLEREYQRAPQGACKILVIHHHLYWNGSWRPFGVWFPTRRLNWLAGLGVELVLNGHTHVPLTVQMPQGIIIAQSGTTMSGRVRHGHGNAYNQIRVEPNALTVRIMEYDASADKFMPHGEQTFPRKGVAVAQAAHA